MTIFKIYLMSQKEFINLLNGGLLLGGNLITSFVKEYYNGSITNF